MATRSVRLRWSTSCASCDTTLAAGTTALWDAETKTASCTSCAAPVPVVDAGVAGRSAAREYERRSARERARKEARVAQDAQWRTEIVAARPVLGRIATAMTARPTIGPESQATVAWAKGEAGELRVGPVLDGCAGTRVLHDRRIPGSKANIDHLVIGPGGVYVVDAKQYLGDIEARNRGGWLRPDVRLYVGGRDRHKLVLGVDGQIDLVIHALEGGGVATPVSGVLCFVGGTWPIVFRRPLVFGTVTALWPDALPAIVRADGPLGAQEIERLHVALATAFPQA